MCFCQLDQNRDEGTPSAETVFEVLDSAQAAKPASCHDADAAAQRLTLLHAVRGQDHCVPCTTPHGHWSPLER